MASRTDDVKVLTMAEEENQQKRTDNRELLRLDSIFGRYVGHIYSLTLSLLADVRARMLAQAGNGARCCPGRHGKRVAFLA